MNLLIAGGGTGGHLYPGIAVARELLREPGHAVLFVGTEQGIEARVLPRENLPVRFISVGRLKGMKFGALLRTVATLPAALVQSLRLVREFRPHVVVGVGGYASGPVAVAAWLLGKPVVIIEPNSYAGLANRWLGRIAAKVVLCFPGRDEQGMFRAEKKALTGPLVRSGIDGGVRREALAAFGLDEGRYTLFVMGGSGGAHAINRAMQQSAPLLAGTPGFQVLHQTGDRDEEATAAAYRDNGVKAVVLPYIHDMAGAYAAADLIVARSGATTVAELAVCGKRAVLIPYPYAADNHQEYNARSLASRGGAEVIVQRDLTPELLAQLIHAAAAGGTAAPAPMGAGAAREIVRLCKAYVQKN